MRLSGLEMTEEKDSLENKFNNSSGFSMLYSRGSVIPLMCAVPREGLGPALREATL